MLLVAFHPLSCEVMTLTLSFTEISANARALCQNKECKDSGVKIQKQELRFGTYVTLNIKGNEASSWKWKHWYLHFDFMVVRLCLADLQRGCVTPVQINSWKEVCEGNPDLIDGYEDMPPGYQEKILRALEQGHVDDDEWKGVRLCELVTLVLALLTISSGCGEESPGREGHAS